MQRSSGDWKKELIDAVTSEKGVICRDVEDAVPLSEKINALLGCPALYGFETSLILSPRFVSLVDLGKLKGILDGI